MGGYLIECKVCKKKFYSKKKDGKTCSKEHSAIWKSKLLRKR